MSKIHLLIYSVFMFIITLTMNIMLIYAHIHWTTDKILLIGMLSGMGYLGAIISFPYKIRFE